MNTAQTNRLALTARNNNVISNYFLQCQKLSTTSPIFSILRKQLPQYPK
jgi:hypothetical protein